jgi:glycosyltransferase involved in cell wall biosynthesis
MPRAATISVVIPARDEVEGVADVVAGVRKVLPGAEILVVDDGSTDGTAAAAEQAGAAVIRHPYPKGNGASIKAGARAATGDVLVFLDGDRQHDPADIPRLLEQIDGGHDLVVGARTARSHASAWRLAGNWVYNRFASWIVGHRVLDLTSGFRAARASLFREFLDLYPNGFSCPTTSTLAFFRAGYSVAYIPVTAGKASGSSHIRLVRDGGRFFVIIFRIGTLYSPLKIFAPVSALLFFVGVAYYSYTYLSQGRFTNFGALLFLSAIIVFMIGLVSEQITTLVFLHRRRP